MQMKQSYLKNLQYTYISQMYIYLFKLSVECYTQTEKLKEINFLAYLWSSIDSKKIKASNSHISKGLFIYNQHYPTEVKNFKCK